MEVIKCVDCGAEFQLDDGELNWYNEKGFTLPKRCPECRKIRKDKKKAEAEQKHRK